MPVSISVVIPAYNCSGHLQACLDALFSGAQIPAQAIVVDDGSTDATPDIARTFPVEVHSSGGRKGPAFARNLGARAATGDILIFLDADVCVQNDTLAKIGACFAADGALDALIGSYNSMPHCPEFLSQYRNLMHSWVHQTGAERASTFWSGCGAIRREVFLEHCGFDEQFGRPAIEDIELGYRLVRAGRKIVLDREIQVTHLKRWTFWNLVKTDILDRGIPWTELILRERFMPNDLNLHLSQRVSVALVFILLSLSCSAALFWGGYFLIPLFAIVYALLARWWIEFATPRRPRLASAVLVIAVAWIAILAWSDHMFGIVPPLAMSPVLLLIGHRYAYTGRRRRLLRWFAVVFTGGCIAMAAWYMPANRLILGCFGILAVLGLMNSQFYIFLAGKRGIPFMLAAIPFHLLYHFYNGLSFIGGIVCYSWTKLTGWRRANAESERPESVLQ